MNELKKTMIYAGTAVILLLLAFITSPGSITPEAFFDQGELFFPEFEDPNTARTLEVYDFDSETGETLPFKVTFQKGRWIIPSHHDYPADAKDRLAETAAGVIGIKKDDFRTDNAADHEACGVIDPLDETSVALTGRGQRITIKGENDVILADFIVGKEVENREGFHFVRVPEQKRVYAVRMNIDISTGFTDWIESDLLEVDKTKIDRIVLNDYSINERTRSLEERDVVRLSKNGDVWKAARMSSNQEVVKDSLDNFLTALDELAILGIRPKPEGISKFLSQSPDEDMKISQQDLLSLQNKGYFLTRDGQLRSNEGELTARMDNGIVYTLRFGEVFMGSGLSVTAGIEEDQSGQESAANRYLFITAFFEEDYFEEPARPTDTSFTAKPDSVWTGADRRNKELQDVYDEWTAKVENSRNLANRLGDRFADWYYVISSESFDKLNLTRNDLIKQKTD